MILRTFNCTIVNQIKSNKKLVVKLKIRNLQLLQVKLALPYQGGCKGISSSEWSFAWASCISSSNDSTSHWICLVVFSNASWPSFNADGTLSGNFPRILLFQANVYLNWQTKYFATLFLSYALLKMQFFFLDSAHWNSHVNKLKILRQQFSYFRNDVLFYFFKRFA